MVTIDAVIEEKRSGDIVLSIHQDLPWNTEGIIRHIATRIVDYVGVIENGSFLKMYPQYKDRRFKIRIVCCEAVPDALQRQMDFFNHKLMSSGIRFEIVQFEIK